MKIINFTPTTGINGQKHRPEKHFNEEYAVIANQKTHLTLRFYSTPSKLYVCVWIADPNHASGSCSGPVYLYSMNDARCTGAMCALQSAGFKFEKEDGDCYHGSSGMYNLLTKVANFLGLKDYYIHNAHA